MCFHSGYGLLYMYQKFPSTLLCLKQVVPRSIGLFSDPWHSGGPLLVGLISRSFANIANRLQMEAIHPDPAHSFRD